MNSSFFGFPQGQLAPTILPPVVLAFFGYDNFADLADGPNNAPSGGFSWAGPGAASMIELNGYDNFADLANGPNNAPNGGYNWAGPGAASVPN